MYPSAKVELAILLRISRELDVCGDLTATVDNPSSSSPGEACYPTPRSLHGKRTILDAASCRWEPTTTGHRCVVT